MCQDAHYLGAAVKEETAFDAEIIGINRGGMRVRLTANGATAFVPASLIHDKKDELAIDDKNGRITVAEQVRFRLADRITVVLAEAREETRSLIARPAGNGGEITAEGSGSPVSQ